MGQVVPQFGNHRHGREEILGNFIDPKNARPYSGKNVIGLFLATIGTLKFVFGSLLLFWQR